VLHARYITIPLPPSVRFPPPAFYIYIYICMYVCVCVPLVSLSHPPFCGSGESHVKQRVHTLQLREKGGPPTTSRSFQRNRAGAVSLSPSSFIINYQVATMLLVWLGETAPAVPTRKATLNSRVAPRRV